MRTPLLADSAVTALVAGGEDVWATIETSVNGGHPTTHVLHLLGGVWRDTRTLEGDSYRFNLLAGGPSGVWRYDWATPDGPPVSIDRWTDGVWVRTPPVAAGWDLGGKALGQLAALLVTDDGASVVRMGGDGVVEFRYAC
jgi:hypothetical protein